jgi:hypothetical protein
MQSHSVEAISLASLNLVASLISTLVMKGVMTDGDVRNMLHNIRVATAENAQAAEILAVVRDTGLPI